MRSTASSAWPVDRWPRSASATSCAGRPDSRAGGSTSRWRSGFDQIGTPLRQGLERLRAPGDARRLGRRRPRRSPAAPTDGTPTSSSRCGPATPARGRSPGSSPARSGPSAAATPPTPSPTRSGRSARGSSIAAVGRAYTVLRETAHGRGRLLLRRRRRARPGAGAHALGRARRRHHRGHPAGVRGGAGLRTRPPADRSRRSARRSSCRSARGPRGPRTRS